MQVHKSQEGSKYLDYDLLSNNYLDPQVHSIYYLDWGVHFRGVHFFLTVVCLQKVEAYANTISAPQSSLTS